MGLPNNVYQVTYKNKNSRGLVAKYQVKKQIQGFKVNRLFDTVEEASIFLMGLPKEKADIEEYLAKTKFVPEILVEDDKPLKALLIEHTTRYLKKKIGSKQIFAHLLFVDNPDIPKEKLAEIRGHFEDVEWKHVKFYQQIFNTITKTAFFITSPKGAMHRVLFGDLPINSIGVDTIGNYINARLEKQIKNKFVDAEKTIPATVQKTTIKRELNYLSSFFTLLINGNYSANYKDLKNPVTGADKFLIDAPYQMKPKKRLSVEDEAKLIKLLKEYPNKEVFIIFSIANICGLRRSEVITLNIKQINFEENIITLNKTKNGKVREVPMLRGVRELILTIEPQENGDLFTYTIDGFKTVFKRLLDRAGIKGYTFHNTRSEAILTMKEQGADSYLIATILGIQNIDFFEKNHMENIKHQEGLKNKTISSEKIVGHSGKQIHYRYIGQNLFRKR